jgi:hypothetical protein
MRNVSSTDLLSGSGASGEFCTEITLFLNDDYNPVTWM